MFRALGFRSKMKKTIPLEVDEKLLKAIEKRAKENHLSVREQVKDIIVRSMSGWGKDYSPSAGDHQVSKMMKIFSKKKTGPKPKAKPKKKSIRKKKKK